MANTAGRTGTPRAVATNDENRLNYACDAGILSGADSVNNVYDIDSEDSDDAPSSESESSESPSLGDLGTSLRIFAESMARIDVAEMEWLKAREASRWEAETRRMELEMRLTGMMVQSQLQIASIVAGKGQSRKRKRVDGEENETAANGRGGALILSLLQCNLIL